MDVCVCVGLCTGVQMHMPMCIRKPGEVVRDPPVCLYLLHLGRISP